MKKKLYLCRNSVCNMNRILIIVLIVVMPCIMILLLASLYFYYRWKVLWELEEPRPLYSVFHSDTDTLRVIMIGDSWAEIHSELQMDSVLEEHLCLLTSQTVEVVSKGKGGMRSRGIYNLMFKTDGYGTKTLIESGADYCIISAGINDASANLGTRQFCYYMNLIIKLLLSNGIRPVIIEAPDVNIWKLFGKRPYKSILVDYIRSLMTGCGMYHYAEYREALKDMLINDQLMDSVVYVSMNGWNGVGMAINLDLFLDDQLHLNRKGYEMLDSCIASAIASDLRK